jgi:hypothetical protein
MRWRKRKENGDDCKQTKSNSHTDHLEGVVWKDEPITD